MRNNYCNIFVSSNIWEILRILFAENINFVAKLITSGKEENTKIKLCNKREIYLLVYFKVEKQIRRKHPKWWRQSLSFKYKMINYQSQI